MLWQHSNYENEISDGTLCLVRNNLKFVYLKKRNAGGRSVNYASLFGLSD